MCTLSCLKNNNYIESRRNYLDDYSYEEHRKIDMTLSGKYLGKYSRGKKEKIFLDKYPSQAIVGCLENEIKKRYGLNKHVIVGAGTNGLMQNLVKIFFKNGGNLVTPFYSFNQVEYAVTSLNGITRRVYMNKNHIDFERYF